MTGGTFQCAVPGVVAGELFQFQACGPVSGSPAGHRSSQGWRSHNQGVPGALGSLGEVLVTSSVAEDEHRDGAHQPGWSFQ